MGRTKTKKETLSMDEEMLMWCAYRYAIGRKTYVSSLAPYIGQKYYRLLSDSRAEFTAMDIRNSIADCLRFAHVSFDYDHTIETKERNPIGDFVTWLNENVTRTEDLYNISKVICYKEGYGDKHEKKYEVQTSTKSWAHTYESDIDNLLIWEDLASLFDKKNHKMLTVEYDCKEETIEAFPVWRHRMIPCEDNPNYLKNVNWRWERVWVGVERYLERGEYTGIIGPEYIVKVEDCN